MNYELPDKYHAAIYVRRKFKDIVMEDEDDPTTTAQVKRIKEQMEEFPDVTIEHIYMDRRRIKQSDPRPEFVHLLQDLHAGKFNCVIMYSLDTFGKDYAENEYYLLKQFPMFKLRIIAIQENYDSLISEPIVGEYKKLLPLVKTVSRKQSSRNRIARCRSNPASIISGPVATPYGYLFNPDNPECLEIDPVCADAIPLIFNEFVIGTPNKVIVQMLEEAGYPCPSLRKIQLGYWSTKHDYCDHWTDSSIRTLVARRTYTGAVVIKSPQKKLYGNEPDTWLERRVDQVIEDHHPALVSKELFEKAQVILKAIKQVNKSTSPQSPISLSPNLYTHIIFCGSCGRKMHYSQFNAKGRFSYGVYRCPSVKYKHGEKCTVPNYLLEEINIEVQKKIDENRALALEYKALLADTGDASLYTKGMDRLDQELADIMAKLSELSKASLLTDESTTDSDTQTADLRVELVDLLAYKRSFYTTMKESNPWISLFTTLPDHYELSLPLVRQFVERITVHPDSGIEIILKLEKEKSQLNDFIQYSKMGR